jgi:lysozyme
MELLMNSESLVRLTNLTKNFEGFRSNQYLCPSGFITIGYGHNCEAHNDVEYYKGLQPIDENLASRLLAEDLGKVIRQCALQFGMFTRLDDVRQAILADMTYNIGIVGMLKFKKMFKAIEIGNWHDAARQMYNSRWARQTDREGPLIFMMITGEWF